MRRLIILLLGVGAAAAAAKYLSDSSRRKQLKYAAGKAKGAVATATPSMPGTHRIDDVDDVTLARKVETEIFRDAEVPKGKINVNAENGKVVLRGEVDEPSLIEDLEQRTKKVQGVREVENLLTAAK